MKRSALAATCAALLLTGSFAAACRQPSQPPEPPPVPPHPTNPTTGTGPGVTLAEIETDASIVREAGPIPPADAGVGQVDAAPVGPR